MSSARWQTPTSSAASAAGRRSSTAATSPPSGSPVAADARRSGGSGRSRRSARRRRPRAATSAARSPSSTSTITAAPARPRRARRGRTRRSSSPDASAGSQRARCSALPACCDRQRGERAAEERRGRHRVAQLLEQHRQLDGAEALAAVLLGDRDAGPAELAQLPPQRVVVGAAPRRPRARARTASGREQLARGRLDLVLVLGEVEVHAAHPPAAGRARARRRCS